MVQIMKRIIITLTHRLDNIKLFAKLLDNQINDYDEWHIWFNSRDNNIKNEILQLINSRKGSIIIPNNSDPDRGLANVPRFWKQDSTDNDAVYIKLDDDIVWMEPGFIRKMFEFKTQNTNNFIVSANVINNAITSFLHVRTGHLSINTFKNGLLGKLPCTDNFLCPYGWANPNFAEQLHLAFIEDIKQNNYQKWYLPNWILDLQQIISINAISWIGSDMHMFLNTMDMGENDEFFIMNYGSIRLNKLNIIYGQAICAHYSFHTQKAYLDKTNILKEYFNLV